MKAFYSDHFVLPLPPGHRFPMAKYAMLRARVAQELPDVSLLQPEAADDAVLGLAHDPAFVRRLAQGTLSPAEQRAIGFPWSEGMVERSRRSAGATLGACRSALVDGVGVNLAGGTHHAHADRGEGFCCFNDAAVATRVLQRDHGVRRVAIVDLDVHQGNGTASILGSDSTVFTLSLHGEKNFPFTKARSHLDLGLPDGTGDAAYLAALEQGLAAIDVWGRPDFVIYLAGADAHEGDRLGRLKLTLDGMGQRDQRVFDWALHHRVPIAVAMAGGYGHDLDTTVAVHYQTVRLAFTHANRVRR